ncbi:GxGYxYP domain-containing protein [Chthonomonas calidirosea]|uniref:Glycoside hydrolase 123 C-terminal domain-containing protein n=1 Tax=Chthonomonas calidirosea (strain DSM 23976 / ICMP 18418 / T49) TaxID=1303518 RepID=S0EX79_CHTCT|nr:GxGYxYP domain-containing protein [Chthonomonas calidirosea]CCW36057.1 GxGYxY sequence motif in domain of unknown function [Chthonomonas calidirosea T49]CEK17415.1 GxGYxY sequence motif in domain of unknown function [Chthonomonas calidirosea]CEK18460.1 GxGYxY sequence motif in domain of unknown function [Chthonomonas calidirosea]
MVSRYPLICGIVCWLALSCFGLWTKAAAQVPEDILREVPPHFEVPSGSYTLVATWAAAGTLYKHGTGKAVSDPQATESKAWEASVGEPSAAMLYGPYITTLPQGDYVAFARVERTSSTDEEIVGTLDACIDYGQNILNSVDLATADLPREHYVEIPLPFHYPGGALEVRVNWAGYANLRVDKVTLFRVEGANLSQFIHRAPPARESGEPNHLTPLFAPAGTPLFPRSHTPASTLEVLDLRKQGPSWQLLLLSLQGLVNRQRPRIYYLLNDQDPFWLRWMRQNGWIKGWKEVTDPHQLLQEYRSVYHGLVVTDPTRPASVNVATMIASIDDLLVATPSLAKELGLPVKEDLRGRWTTDVQAYQWAFDNLWPHLNHEVISCTYPQQMPLRDYLVENRIFIFWISGPIDGARPGADPTAEMHLMEQLLAKMPADAPVISYPYAGQDVGVGEGPGVTLFAEFGRYLVGSTDCSNLSVHSGIRLPNFHQRHPAPPKLDPRKVYVSWILSDGDNLPVLSVFNFPVLWKSPVRGTMPIGWTISPSSWLLMPDIANYYYQTASPDDQFVGAVSGIGYTYPDSFGARYKAPYRQEVFDRFLYQTAEGYRHMDIVDGWIMGITHDSLLDRYAEDIPTLQALFPDYGRRVGSYDEATYPIVRNLPVFHAVTNWNGQLSREEQIDSLVEQIKAITPERRPAFLHLFALNWFTDLSMLPEIMRRLGPDYVVVRPDVLGALYREYLKKEKLLVSCPNLIARIIGLPLRFQCTLENVESHPVSAQVRVTDGMTDVEIEGNLAALAPDVKVPVSVAGVPQADTVQLEATVEGGPSHRTTVQLRSIDPSELVGGLEVLRTKSGTLPTLSYVQHFDVSALAHQTGAMVTDPRAIGGRAWQVLPGKDQAGHALFGPYVPMPAGDYLALFRIERVGEQEGSVGLVDSCVGGGVPVLAERGVLLSELPLGRYVYVPLVFHHPGGALETRFYWDGKVGVRMDGVDLWRISGGTTTTMRRP